MDRLKKSLIDTDQIDIKEQMKEQRRRFLEIKAQERI